MKHAKKIAAIGALALVVGLTFPAPAWALLNNIFGKKAAPQQAAQPEQYYVHDEESFQSVAKAFHRIPFNDPQLEFEILLPKDWTTEQTLQTSSSGELSQRILGEIARFKSPYINTMQAIVSIQSVKLDREITAEHWLKNYILTSGYEMDGKINVANEKKANVACVSTVEGKSSYIQAAALINGSNVVIIKFETPLYLKDYLAFLRQRSIDSFKFIMTTDKPIETQRVFNFGNTLRFSYPESWYLAGADVTNPTRMSMQLYNKDIVSNPDDPRQKLDKVLGVIRFVMIQRHANTTFRKETDDIRRYFTEQMGLDFQNLISSDKAPVSGQYLFSRYEIYQVASKKEENAPPRELRLVTLGDKDWYVFAFLLTPMEATNFYLWATNTRAFDIVLNTLK